MQCGYLKKKIAGFMSNIKGVSAKIIQNFGFFISYFYLKIFRKLHPKVSINNNFF